MTCSVDNFTFNSRHGFTYDSIPSQLSETAPFKYKYSEAFPRPDGVSEYEWNKSFNAANSRIYNDNKKDSMKAKRIRESTDEIRHLAEELQRKKMRASSTLTASSTAPVTAFGSDMADQGATNNLHSPDETGDPQSSSQVVTLSSILATNNSDNTALLNATMDSSIPSNEASSAGLSQPVPSIAEKVKGKSRAPKAEENPQSPTSPVSSRSEQDTPAPKSKPKKKKKKGTAQKVAAKHKHPGKCLSKLLILFTDDLTSHRAFCYI